MDLENHMLGLGFPVQETHVHTGMNSVEMDSLAGVSVVEPPGWMVGG